jgi:hypothetical protein
MSVSLEPEQVTLAIGLSSVILTGMAGIQAGRRYLGDMSTCILTCDVQENGKGQNMNWNQ